MRSKVLKGILAVVVAVAVAVVLNATRPLITAPKGTQPLDNKLDTASVERFLVDEADVLSEDMEKVISIYNANWNALAGRVLAVVTVESVENAEDEAWQWMQRLSMGDNDALLLIETTGGKKCALVSCGTFREDIATLSNVYLSQLTYQDIRAGYFNAAVLAVFDRFHYFYGYDSENYRQTMVREGLVTFAILAALVLSVLIHMIAEMVDKRRFERWYDDYGITDPTIVPWRTVFFWHRVGSRWYEQRVSGEWVDIHASVVSNRRNQKTKWYRRR